MTFSQHSLKAKVMIFWSCVSFLQPKFAPAYSSQLALPGFELWIAIHPGQHSAHQAYFTCAFWQDSVLSWCLTQWISILTHEPCSHDGVISSLCLTATLQTLLFQIKGAVFQRDYTEAKGAALQTKIAEWQTGHLFKAIQRSYEPKSWKIKDKDWVALSYQMLFYI